MGDLLQSVTNGSLNANRTDTSSSSSNNTLGKDAFLQLLVTQMKYQDPLNPSSDTEYIAQLATFSQLEQMQNLNATNSNSQAFGLVGKTVVVKTTDAAGNTKYVDGVVDFVTVSNGTAKLAIGDNLYTMDQLVEVYDDKYILSLGAPTVEEAKLEVDYENPKDVTINLSMGTTSQASALAVIVNGTVIKSEYLSMENGKLTIKPEAFKEIPEGTYNVVLCFNDPLETTISNQVQITIKGKYVEPDKEETEGSEGSKEEDKKEEESLV